MDQRGPTWVVFDLNYGSKPIQSQRDESHKVAPAPLSFIQKKKKNPLLFDLLSLIAFSSCHKDLSLTFLLL